jgi:hypothetical protein
MTFDKNLDLIFSEVEAQSCPELGNDSLARSLRA